MVEGRHRSFASAQGGKRQWRPSAPGAKVGSDPQPLDAGDAGGPRARASIKDPALAELVRSEQDLGKQVGAQLGLLNNILALPSAERDPQGVKAVNASIDKLRTERDQARAEINKRFPAYADLVAPKPPNVAQVQATLVEGEAMLSFYFGRDASFVWAVPKDGPVAFAEIKATRRDPPGKCASLREAARGHRRR